tara:strand:+ start:258 stop:998 length:741 start_codon:yes stop_codon:yes gene_type:complete
MAIKIKHRDPKSTDFSSTDIIININEGTLFYKTPTGLFKLQGDNLNTTTIETIGGGGGASSFSELTDVPFLYSSSLQILTDITSSGNISGSSPTSTFSAVTGSFDIMSKQLAIIPFTFAHLEGNSEVFIPIKNYLDKTSFNYYHGFIPPYDGKLKKITLGPRGANPGNTTLRLRKDAGGDFDLDEAGDIVQAITVSSLVANSVYDFNFTSATFSKGDLISFTYQHNNNSDNIEIMGSLVLEFNTAT